MTRLIIYIFFIAAFSLIYGCTLSHNTRQESYHVAVLRGPTAIAFAGWIERQVTIQDKPVQIEIIDSPEQMQALLFSGKADIVVLPMISAANLFNKGVNYQLAGCPVWGNLYLAQQKDISPDDQTLYIFGAGTTPDILTRYYCEQNNLSYSYNYTFPTIREVVQGIYAGRVKRAVLAEPYLSMVLRQDTTFRIIGDLNNPEEQSSTGFPQTAILYHSGFLQNRAITDSLLTISCKYAQQNPSKVIRIMEEQNIFPEGVLTTGSIERCRINYLPAAQIEKDVYKFLELIHEYEPRAIGGKIPDNNFIADTP